MTELLALPPTGPRAPRVLEVGTGSGYQTAVLAELGVEVFTIEYVPSLAARAHEVLDALGYTDRVHARVGDGYQGWPEEAPFDAIVVTAAPPRVPAPLVAQLGMGGRMVVPVGEAEQELVVITMTEAGPRESHHAAVRFVPMVGLAQRRPARRAPRAR